LQSIRKAIPKDRPTPIVAVKFINKEHAFKIGRLKPKQMQTEMVLHEHLKRNKNIIEFMGHGQDDSWLWIAMELAEGGDLFDKIEADVGVGGDIAHFYFTQLINAVSYMHTKGIAHRDLKPENILLSADGNLKVADFGLATLFQHHGKTKVSKAVVGSPPYMAPEIVQSAGKEPGYEPNVADIWSCAVVLFVLLVGNTPWDEPTSRSFEFKDFVSLGGRGNLEEDELWARIPPGVLSLIHGMLKLDTKKRLSLNDIRIHPWFTQQNHHLNNSGQAADPIKLATQMMENLRVDFNVPTPSQRRGPSHSDPMELDHQPPQAVCSELDQLKISSTQPGAPMAEDPFGWERRTFDDSVSASQPLHAFEARMSSTQLSPHISNILANDISLSQFSCTPSVPLSRTQAARKFNDIVPSHTNARFVSTLPLKLLAEFVSNALHRMGVQAAPNMRQDNQAHSAYLQVSTKDDRGQGMKGTIIMESCGPDVHEVRFVKAKGDPLEWRRFFKRVCFHCKDAIIVPQ